jgi:hypothetical protein
MNTLQPICKWHWYRAHAPGDWVLPLLSQCPGTRLIGLNAATDQSLVISGQLSVTASLQDLAALIEQVAAPRARTE